VGEGEAKRRRRTRGPTPRPVVAGGRAQRRRQRTSPASSPLLSREPVAESDPHPSTRGIVAQGKDAEGPGFFTSSATKRCGKLARANSARGCLGQGKGAEPLGKGCNQTSPYGENTKVMVYFHDLFGE
jgi:hypothetical protein